MPLTVKCRNTRNGNKKIIITTSKEEINLMKSHLPYGIQYVLHMKFFKVKNYIIDLIRHLTNGHEIHYYSTVDDLRYLTT